MLSESRINELYHYASSYETFDERTPNGTPCTHGGWPMNDERRAAIIAYKKVLGLLPDDFGFSQPPESRMDALERRVTALEKHSHVPVTFVEDEDGYLKVARDE